TAAKPPASASTAAQPADSETSDVRSAVMTRTTTATTSTPTTTTTPKAPGKQRRVRLAKDATSSSDEDTESNSEDTRGPSPTVSAKSRAASKTPSTRGTGKQRRKALAGMATTLNDDDEPGDEDAETVPGSEIAQLTTAVTQLVSLLADVKAATERQPPAARSASGEDNGTPAEQLKERAERHVVTTVRGDSGDTATEVARLQPAPRRREVPVRGGAAQRRVQYAREDGSPGDTPPDSSDDGHDDDDPDESGRSIHFVAVLHPTRSCDRVPGPAVQFHLPANSTQLHNRSWQSVVSSNLFTSSTLSMVSLFSSGISTSLH
ncbi:hypothetical protein F441_21857, partial [Phytophthora nicotianae CJ01A1]